MRTSRNATRRALVEPFVNLAQQQAAARLGLWIFLANEILFFGGFFAAYAFGRWAHANAFAAASRHLNWQMGAIESAVLLLSSYTASIAMQSVEQDARRIALWMLRVTALLGVVFLLMHGSEYADEFGEHLLPGAGFAPQPAGEQLFFHLYYAMTSFHALHVLVGVVLLALYSQRLARGSFTAQHHPPLALTSLYWHFVDVVWMFLFPLFYLIDRT
jgi:cytochrome c oxidase subunit 3